MNVTELQKIKDWLIDGARSSTEATGMFSDLCERLIAAGVPLWRVGLFVHPAP
jgi:adenylate cyclase